jgi:hypothetical protein
LKLLAKCVDTAEYICSHKAVAAATATTIDIFVDGDGGGGERLGGGTFSGEPQ